MKVNKSADIGMVSRRSGFFSVVDIIETLTKSERPRKYWSDLKVKLEAEGSELSAKIGQLKMRSSDGKYYSTDAEQKRFYLQSKLVIQRTFEPTPK